MNHLPIYLDPGSGSLIIQLVVAALLGIGVAVRIFWSRIKALFSGKKEIPVTHSQPAEEFHSMDAGLQHDTLQSKDGNQPLEEERRLD